MNPEHICIIGICGWGGMAINAAAIDTRVKATVAVTMYDMTRVTAKGYFDSEDSEEERYQKRAAMNCQRTVDLRTGNTNGLEGFVTHCRRMPLAFLRDYYDYYKQQR